MTGPSSEINQVEWICENCKTVYAEYVNGCPKCWHQRNGTRAKVVAVPIAEAVDFIMRARP